MKLLHWNAIMRIGKIDLIWFAYAKFCFPRLIYHFYVPMNWIGLFVSMFTLITSYAFEKQRKFPVSVAYWTVYII
jgi:hypothetical protein